ncbi:hypothetical protein NDU88_000971 [Pleurodeles waltl]|uniref:Uncharacterized protein n=1 Tax=Pleurodeles waltl TaxID=8319 RepID=A0AAV7TGJ0_PLEWA|nr:hypothetical protein NDU88_000971 [Pleurodeles waltl]
MVSILKLSSAAVQQNQQLVGGLTEIGPGGLVVDGVEEKGPVTRSFKEALFDSFQEDLQTVEKELSQDLKDVRRNKTEVGDRFSALKDHESSRDKVLEQLQQELLNLQDLQITLQAHALDLKNR